MKRQTQQTGVRKYFGGDLIALQAEPLKALDAFFAEYGACVIQGCALEALADGHYNIGTGLVALSVTDLATDERRVMVMPFDGAQNVVLPLYLVASTGTEQRVYGDGRVKPIAYNYTATASAIKPDQGVDHLIITSGDCVRFVDALQDAAHRFVSDGEKSKWNAKAAANHNHDDRYNNYVHPDDANTRHVSDGEKSTWNAKASGDHNHDDRYNNYVHPADANTRHVSDGEKSTWNAKASGDHNHDDRYNNYVHPADANTRHVSDGEKSTWNAKASGSHTHNYAPTTHTHNELVSTDGSIAVSKSGIMLPRTAVMNIPGILCAGTVGLKGQISAGNQWGCKVCWSERYNSETGKYKLTHNIKHLDYYVTANIISDGFVGSVVMLEKTTTYVVFAIGGLDGNFWDKDFDFMICGQN